MRPPPPVPNDPRRLRIRIKDHTREMDLRKLGLQEFAWVRIDLVTDDGNQVIEITGIERQGKIP